MLKKWHKYFHRCMVYKRNFLFHQLLHLQDSQAAYQQRKAGAAAKLFQYYQPPRVSPASTGFPAAAATSFSSCLLTEKSRRWYKAAASTTSGFTSCCIYKFLQLPFDRNQEQLQSFLFPYLHRLSTTSGSHQLYSYIHKILLLPFNRKQQETTGSAEFIATTVFFRKLFIEIWTI